MRFRKSRKKHFWLAQIGGEKRHLPWMWLWLTLKSRFLEREKKISLINHNWRKTIALDNHSHQHKEKVLQKNCLATFHACINIVNFIYMGYLLKSCVQFGGRWVSGKTTALSTGVSPNVQKTDKSYQMKKKYKANQRSNVACSPNHISQFVLNFLLKVRSDFFF